MSASSFVRVGLEIFALLGSAATLSAAPASVPVTAPAVRADPSAAATPCIAIPRGAFHLRPRPERKSSGPELRKRTRLRVLQQIAQPDTERRGLSLYHLEVEADHRQGYAYLRPSELGRSCPLLWPNATYLVMNQPFALDVDKSAEVCLARGPTRRQEELLHESCRAQRAELRDGKRLDVDGDGRTDQLVTIGQVLAIVRHRATGWVSELMAFLPEGSIREEQKWQAPVVAGSAVYVRYVTYAWENFSEETEDDGTVLAAESDQTNTVALARVLADGNVYRVFAHQYSGELDSCGFVGHPDQSVTLRCREGSVRLRWDEPLRRLVPTLSVK